jgi:DNA-binding response OmpR family regulator
MTLPLKILNLGEDPRDAEPITSALEEIGISCKTFRVATFDELISAIEQGGFDIIFTDQTLPGFDGLTARAIAKERSSKYTVYVHFGDRKRKE